ncbi:MAG: YfiR family protein [Verrucomicrobiota bacterium]
MKSGIAIDMRRALIGGLQFILRLAVVVMAFVSLNAAAQANTGQEYQIKAAFLFNFAQYVQWPSNSFPETKTPLVIGIVGVDPFGAMLDDLVRGENVNGHPLVVQRYRRVEEIKACHILFSGESERKRLEEIFGQTKGRSVLTVGEAETFIRQGGMVRFYTESGKIRFEINVEATKQSNLEVSSRLLRLARVASPNKP